MAKASQKKKLLMPEEKLDEALIPNTEEPYSVPSNWCWTKMGVVAKWGSGGTPSRKNDDYYNGTIPWVKTGELDDDFIWETEEHISEQAIADSSAKLFPINTIIIAMYGATIGKVGILGLEATTNQACACGVSSAALLYKYLFYYARSQKEAFIGMGKGGAQPNISQEIIKEHPIPLPPLTEQQRIVDRIESLFAKLDEAKEKAQAVVDGFEDRKAAILHKAFTGDITKKWREAQTIAPSYETVTIDSVCVSLKYGTAKKSVDSGDVVVIRMGNLQQGEIDWTNLAYSNDEEDNIKYKLFPDDVLFNRTNSPELVGKTAIYRGEYPAIYAGYLIKLDYDHSRVIGDYLNYILNSPEAKEYCSKVKSDGVNQSNINAKKIGAFTFRLPQISEQQEIVDTIKLVLEKEKNAKDAALQTVDYIESIKRAILARAFRGELGTNDPNDESALELLKKVLSMEPTPQPHKKGVSIPKDMAGELKTNLEKQIVKLFLQKSTDTLAIKEIMNVSSKTFEVLDALRDLEKRKIVKKNHGSVITYTLLR